ncbi:MAG: peptide-methionine (S)-S-oxide reductase MsrA [Nitrososphaerales archaeon]
MELATLGGGCFWCLEAVYDEVKGIEKAESGYSGGAISDPSYQAVSEGVTGHAEVVQLTFDPEKVTYREVLEIFFTIHDPTTLDRQGADVGSQYRSIIFYHTGEQKGVAEKVVEEMASANIWSDPIVTEIVQFQKFYKAEKYHQKYFQDNSWQPYCQAVIVPKITKLRKQWQEKLKKAS